MWPSRQDWGQSMRLAVMMGVALVCGGDPGIYAMAGLVFELARSIDAKAPIDVIPGIAALNSCAALRLWPRPISWW